MKHVVPVKLANSMHDAIKLNATRPELKLSYCFI